MKVRTHVKAGGILSQHNESLVRPGALRAGAGQGNVHMGTRRARAACFGATTSAGLSQGLATPATALSAAVAVMPHDPMHPSWA